MLIRSATCAHTRDAMKRTTFARAFTCTLKLRTGSEALSVNSVKTALVVALVYRITDELVPLDFNVEPEIKLLCAFAFVKRVDLE